MLTLANSGESVVLSSWSKAVIKSLIFFAIIYSPYWITMAFQPYDESV